MRILAINDHPYSGGAAQLFKRTNTILKNAGHTVCEVTCETDLEVPPVHSAEKHGMSEQSAKNSNGSYFHRKIELAGKYIEYLIRNYRQIRYPYLSRYLRHVLSNNDFDIAHIHNLHGNMSTEVFSVIASFGVPIVYQINDYYFFCNSYFAYNKKLDVPCKKCINGNPLWALYNGCSQYLGHGNSLVESIKRYALHKKNPWARINSFIVTGDKTSEILQDYGINKDNIYKSKNPMIIKEMDIELDRSRGFIYYGTFHTLKGTDTFLKSVEYLDSGIEIEYYVLGTSQDYLDRLIDVCKKRNIKLKYDCTIEWRNGLKEIIAQAYSIIVPSKWWVTSENVVYEGMLLGKAMIVGDAGGNAELIENGKTGLLFNCTDPEDLAEKINLLNKNREFGTELGLNSYKQSRKMFSEEGYLSNLLDIYEKTILNERQVLTNS